VTTTEITIPGHLILPYGTAHAKGKLIKDLSSVKLKAVATNGIYLESDIPVVYIDTSKKQPLDLMAGYWRKIVPQDWSMEQSHHIASTLDYFEKHLSALIAAPTKAQLAFLNTYFDHLKESAHDKYLSNDYANGDKRVFNALIPLPEMQIYVSDPLNDRSYGGYAPENNFRVDFGFWTGTKLIAVEIDGNNPQGYADDVRRDRLLRRANIDVFHLTNSEVLTFGKKIIHVLPEELGIAWLKRPSPGESDMFFPY
jgi:hypothetical protein